jgi:hypothetical protein
MPRIYDFHREMSKNVGATRWVAPAEYERNNHVWYPGIIQLHKK